MRPVICLRAHEVCNFHLWDVIDIETGSGYIDFVQWPLPAGTQATSTESHALFDDFTT